MTLAAMLVGFAIGMAVTLAACVQVDRALTLEDVDALELVPAGSTQGTHARYFETGAFEPCVLRYVDGERCLVPRSFAKTLDQIKEQDVYSSE